MAEVGIQVDFVGIRSFWINPAALARLGPFSIGQPVRVKNDPYTTNSMELHITSQEATKVSSRLRFTDAFYRINHVLETVDVIVK